jgi:hypothetical protein
MKAEKLRSHPIAVGVLAGLWGGVAEIAWIAAYSSAAGTSALAVAGEVSAALMSATAGVSAAPLAGVALHMLLSVAIGVAFGFAYRLVLSNSRPIPMMLAAIATLLAICNFFFLLPVIHPSFVTLMPLTVTLVSKLLFGATMGWTFQTYRTAFARSDDLTFFTRLLGQRSTA